LPTGLTRQYIITNISGFSVDIEITKTNTRLNSKTYLSLSCKDMFLANNPTIPNTKVRHYCTANLPVFTLK